jgi:hypothetical protein
VSTVPSKMGKKKEKSLKIILPPFRQGILDEREG